MVACLAHNQEVVSSNLTLATKVSFIFDMRFTKVLNIVPETILLKYYKNEKLNSKYSSANFTKVRVIFCVKTLNSYLLI